MSWNIWLVCSMFLKCMFFLGKWTNGGQKKEVVVSLKNLQQMNNIWKLKYLFNLLAFVLNVETFNHIIVKHLPETTHLYIEQNGSFLTYPVQSVNGNCLKSPPHHGVLLQHLIEIVHRERIQATVGVRTHTGCPSATGQQADLWRGERYGQNRKWQTHRFQCVTAIEKRRETLWVRGLLSSVTLRQNTVTVH